jgi:tRNA A-37 threonylcarbamoyl transferase component Bud32
MQQALNDSGINGVAPDSPPAHGRLIASTPPELAERFPQLEILELLGQGGMGAVYKARQKKLDRVVALKIMAPQVAADPAFAERFAREARALARLNHANIVAVHDYGETGGLYYFIMEYVDGLNLRQLMRDKAIEPGIALQIVPQICDALQYAHDEEVVHRDIKPENILVDKRGRVKIADFGLAKLVGGAPAYTLTGSHQVMGTPHYMAPEQMEKPSSVDHRADIYSLGVVFYEMLTGGLPLGRFAPPSHKAGVDRRLDDVVLRALEKEPASRYQSISEVKTAIEWIAGSPGTAAEGEPAPAAITPDELGVLRAGITKPAVALIFTGVVSFISWVVIAVIAFKEYASLFDEGSPIGYLILLATALGSLAVIVASLLVIAGGMSMMRLKSYSLALTAAILAALPWSLAFPLGLIIGLWAVTMLQMPQVKAAFLNGHSRLARKSRAVTGVGGFFHALHDFVFDTIARRESTIASAPVTVGQSAPARRAPVRFPEAGRALGAWVAAAATAPRETHSTGEGKDDRNRNLLISTIAIVGCVDIVVVALALILSKNPTNAGIYSIPICTVVWMAFTYALLARALGQKEGAKAWASPTEEEETSTLAGLSAECREIRRRLESFQSTLNCYIFPELDSDLQSVCRKACNVPPDERVLGLIDFTGNEDGDNVLFFGCHGLHFCNYKKSRQPGAQRLPYDEFAKRSFVNHGRDVYLGDNQYLCTDPDADVDCEAVTNLLNAVREIMVNSVPAAPIPPTPPVPPAPDVLR